MGDKLRERLEACLSAARDRRVFPGAVVGVVDDSGRRCIVPWGTHTYEESMPVAAYTIYDVASITKAIPVSSLALRLIERQRLRVDDALVAFVPEYRGAFAKDIRIRHLLTHTLDFGYRLSSLSTLSSEEILDRILNGTLASPPGSTYSYANATSILLGLVIERVERCSLEVCAHREFFGPLGMEDTAFDPSPDQRTRIPPSEVSPNGEIVQGDVHDESARALRPRVVGSAGLFSTVEDLLRFLHAFLRTDNKGLFRDAMRAAICRNQGADIGAVTGLGWELAQPRFMGSRCSSRTIGKTGFTGCSSVIDFERGKAVVLLSNHTFPHRRPDRREIDTVRRTVADLAWDDE